MSKETKEVEVRIYSIATSFTESIVFLEEVHGIRILPIWIGPVEAQAIAIKMSGFSSPRPMTHDLLYRIIYQTKMRVEKVVIDDLIDNTYYAKIYLVKPDNEVVVVDSRPSDAIALSVRCGCLIYINKDILEKTQTISKPISEEEVKDFKEKLKDFITAKDILGEHPQKKEKKEGEDEQKTDDR